MGRNAAAALPPTRAYAQEAKFFCRERFKTVPHRFTLQPACPVLDTGKNEGNPAKPETGGTFLSGLLEERGGEGTLDQSLWRCY
jgi:hypothetical protein